MLKNYSVVGIVFEMTEGQNVDERLFEIFTTTFVSRFYAFLWY